MENLKEIALKVAKEMRDKSEYDALDLVCNAEPFAVALLTEIAKENEPIAWCVSYEDASGFTIHSNPTMRKELAECIASQAASHVSLCNLYAFPPSTEQIENRVAEACAKLLDTEWNGDADTYAEAEIANQCAEAIRRGAWNEYLK